MCDHLKMFEIGDSLREARLRRGISFEQISHDTKIRGKYLRALEGEQFDQLPSPTYVKGFLDTYADYLGLEGQLYVDEYNSRFVTDSEWISPRRSPRPHDRRDRGIQTSIVMIAIALIAIVMVVVISAWQVSNGGAGHRTGTGRTATTHPRTVPAASAYLSIDALRGDSYVEVNRDGPGGSVLFQGTLQRGAVLPFTGKYFWVNVASPGNVAITVGGASVALTGRHAESLTVTPNGVRAD